MQYLFCTGNKCSLKNKGNLLTGLWTLNEGNLLALKASGGDQVLAHVSKPYARDFLVHICALNAILLKNYKW